MSIKIIKREISKDELKKLAKEGFGDMLKIAVDKGKHTGEMAGKVLRKV